MTMILELNLMSFRDFLYEYADREDVYGDFAKMALSDRRMPKVFKSSQDVYLYFFKSNTAHRTIRAGANLFSAYKSSLKPLQYR